MAMKACIEAIIALRYKLQMFGMRVELPAKIFSNNQSIVSNSTRVKLMLNKKHNLIAYHMLRWATAARIVQIGWISTKDNLADPMTKRLTPENQDYLFGNWTY